MTASLNQPLVTLIVGLMMGASGVILFFKRMDHTGENGCFYTLLVALVALIGLGILLGVTSG